MGGDFVDLFGFWRVFGVIDADDRATTEIEREIQGARFGFDAAARHDDLTYPARQVCAGDGLLGDQIVLFDHQTDIQKFAWICEPRHPFDQPRGHFAFFEQGQHDGHGRQGGFAAAGGKGALSGARITGLSKGGPRF